MALKKPSFYHPPEKLYPTTNKRLNYWALVFVKLSEWTKLAVQSWLNDLFCFWTKNTSTHPTGTVGFLVAAYSTDIAGIAL